MILIADSGSTKTDWRVIDKQSVSEFSSIGLNPYFHSSEDIKAELLRKFPAEIDKTQIKNIFFYGSGCGSERSKKIVFEALNALIPKSVIKVESDILGAARALFKDEKGIAIILGTGANSCLYDGNEIIENLPSFGYILGDEGSAASMGLKFLKLYLSNDIDKDISERFNEYLGIDTSEILNIVYRQKSPNRFLASITKFLYDNLYSDKIENLIQNEFQVFISRLKEYSNFQSKIIKATGSVSFYFSKQLKQAALSNSVSISEIIQSPIELLVKYHR